MWRKWYVWLGLALVLFGSSMAFRSVAPIKPKINLILITLDTTRADHLGCYGYDKALTPTLDELARRGVLFEHAYTPAPLTLPAHASIHTGVYPFQHGVFTNGRNHLGNSFPTLAEKLALAQYATSAFVSSFVLSNQFGLNRGFPVYDDTMAPRAKDSHGYPQRGADLVVDAALPWLGEHVKDPFFCWLHFYDPHVDYVDHSASFGDRFQDHPYDGEIAFVDLQIKRVIDFLESQKLTDRTMIIVVGDHGEGLGEHRERWHGHLLYNSTLRVPLIVSLPSLITSQIKIDTAVSVVNIAATALDCLGLTPSTGVPVGGRSLKPALLGQSIPADDCYGESDEAYLEEGWSPLRCLVTDDWKFIQTTKPELYDLKNDPSETTNLADAKPDLVQELNNRLSSLESEGVRHAILDVTLSDREQRVLSSLGYTGGRKASLKPESDENLPDLKDSMALVYAYQTAQDLFRHGQRDAALTQAKQLAEDAPHYLAPQLMVGRILDAEGQHDEAKQFFEGILRVDPNNKEANARVGRILARQEQYRESLPYLVKALDPDARGNQGTAAAEALPFLLKALEANPKSAELHYIVAKMFRVQGREGEAMKHMRTADTITKGKGIEPGSAP